MVTQNVSSPLGLDFYPHHMHAYKEASTKSELDEVHRELMHVGESIRELSYRAKVQEGKLMHESSYMEGINHVISFLALGKVISVILVLIGEIWWIHRFIHKFQL
jgi:hypothetical protein